MSSIQVLQPIFVTIFISAIALWLGYPFAKHYQLLDYPSGRKQHKGDVPLIGGFAIFFGALAGALVTFHNVANLSTFFIAGSLLLLLGALDDRFSISVALRFFMQAVAVVFVAWTSDTWLFYLGDLIGLGEIFLPTWLAVPFTVFAVIGVINAVNMIDGIDGLAGMLSFISLISMGIFAWGADRMSEAWLALIFSVSIVPYLFCNLGACGSTRRVFMGDAGSMLLGFVIAWLAIVLSQPSESGQEAAFAPVTAIWLFLIPIADTLSVMLRRILKGRSPFIADRQHLHHVVQRMGYQDRHALLFVVVLSVFFLGIGFWMEFSAVSEHYRFLGFLAFFAVFFLILVRVWVVTKLFSRAVSSSKSLVWMVFGPLIKIPAFGKRALLFFFDGTLVYVALASALVLRFGDWAAASYYFQGPLGLLVLSAPLFAFPFFVWFGLYRAVVRYFGSKALWAVVGAVSCYILFYAGAWVLLRSSGAIEGKEPLPLGALFVHAMILVLAVGGVRMVARAVLRNSAQRGSEKNKVKSMRLGALNRRILIAGDSDAAVQLARGLQESFDMHVIGFIGERNDMHNRIVYGLPVIPLDGLKKFVLRKKITDIILVGDDVFSPEQRKQVDVLHDSLGRIGVRVRSFPRLDSATCGRVQWSSSRHIDVPALLRRNPIRFDQDALRVDMSRKTVLVFGAGIGIARALGSHLLALNPEKLILFDPDRFSLQKAFVELQREIIRLEGNKIRSYGDLQVLPQIIPLFGSLNDSSAINQTMSYWQPDVVMYADEFTDLSIAERNSLEVLKTSVIGLCNVACAAVGAKVPTFVFISTDKAKHPATVVSASKRLAEMTLEALAAAPAPNVDFLGGGNFQLDNQTHFSIVRLAEVFDASNGIGPMLFEQLDAGGPINLDHVEVGRHFVSMNEACDYIVAALALSKRDVRQAEIFTLDVGAPADVYRIARRIVEGAGLRIKDQASPDGDIEFKIPRMILSRNVSEKSAASSAAMATENPYILKILPDPISWSDMQVQLRTLRAALDANDAEAACHLLKKNVSDFKPHSSAVGCV